MLNIQTYSDYLFPNTNFFIGVGSTFNLAGNYYEFNSSESPELADANAIGNDWKSVGLDIQSAICEFTEEVNGKSSY